MSAVGDLLRVLRQTLRGPIPGPAATVLAGCGEEERELCALRNRRAILAFMDEALSASTAALEARLRVVDAAEDALQAQQERRGGWRRRVISVDELRAAIARQMLFHELVGQVVSLLASLEEEEAAVHLHEVRDVFLEAHSSAALVHPEFGRLCAVLAEALMTVEDEDIEAKRPGTMVVAQRVARAFAAVDLAFLGEWGQERVRLILEAVGISFA